jgi:hypothetical protein
MSGTLKVFLFKQGLLPTCARRERRTRHSLEVGLTEIFFLDYFWLFGIFHHIHSS